MIISEYLTFGIEEKNHIAQRVLSSRKLVIDALFFNQFLRTGNCNSLLAKPSVASAVFF